MIVACIDWLQSEKKIQLCLLDRSDDSIEMASLISVSHSHVDLRVP